MAREAEHDGPGSGVACPREGERAVERHGQLGHAGDIERGSEAASGDHRADRVRAGRPDTDGEHLEQAGVDQRTAPFEPNLGRGPVDLGRQHPEVAKAARMEERLGVLDLAADREASHGVAVPGQGQLPPAEAA